MKRVIFCSKDVFFEKTRVFRGRRGVSGTVRAYHRYILPPDPGVEEFVKDGVVYVGYSVEYPDHRAVRVGKSKSRLIVDFLRDNSGRAWFSKQISGELKDRGVSTSDVMRAVRRYAEKNLIYIRGYKTEDNVTPFRDGFLLTWIDQDKPQQVALDEAFERTEKALFRIDASATTKDYRLAEMTKWLNGLKGRPMPKELEVNLRINPWTGKIEAK